MKKLILLLLLIPSFLFAGVMPVDKDLGLLTNHDITKAFYNHYSVDWLDNYVAEEYQKVFSKMYSKELLSILPLKNIIVSNDENSVKIKDTAKSILIVITLDESGKIVDFKRVH